MTEHEIFTTALAKTDPAERAVYLEQACGTNTDLRQRVDELLQANKPTDAAPEPAAADAGDDTGRAHDGPTADPPPSRTTAEAPHAWIGPYKLLRQIGEGGMGSVHMAEQEKPVRRRVALKLIKPGMSSAKVVARFEAERQALAMMDHPSIARVLDAGATDSGQPYFVMELVKGVPITQYCDANHLTPQERLQLFIPVCQAIQHAHQKGVIHRDIKPSNVLVTFQDGRSVPKVIDFGVAKAIDQRLTERTLYTELGAIVGTPEYMSPEQARLTGEDIDTRSDVYALGVLLYELLTGSTPLRKSRLREAGFEEILRRIREEEPPKPSTRLSTTEAIASIAAQRRIEPAKLARLVRGELDWIVMKALEKDRARRYETASGLARDIERYLADEPVEASPPSARYRLGKFARKHRAPLWTAGAFAAVLVAATVTSLWQAVRATKAEALAQANLETARKEEANARRSSEEAEAVLGFFRDKVVAAARPEGQEGGLGKDVSLRAALEAAERSIAADFKTQPAVEASIRTGLGESYYYLGDLSRAIQQLESALVIGRVALGPDHSHTLATMNDLAVAYAEAGRTADAIPLQEEVHKLRKAKLGAEHADVLRSANNLAAAYLDAGRIAEAVALHEQTLELKKKTLGQDDSETLSSLNNLAAAYLDAGRVSDAIASLEQAVKSLRRTLGPDHPITITSMTSLANAYMRAGRLADAIPLHEEALKRKKATLTTDHPDTLLSMNSLGGAYLVANRWREAESMLRECLELRAKKQADDWQRFFTMSQLGAALSGREKYAEAEPLLIQGYEGLKTREAKIPARRKKELAAAAARIAPFYDAWGKPEKAAEWRKTLGSGGEKDRPKP